MLTVDDSPAYLAAMADVVEATPGFELAGQAESGADAVRIAAETPVDLVLMDVRMPGMDGRAAAAQLRAAAAAPVVVLLTAGTMEGAERPALNGSDGPVVDKRDLRPALLERLWAKLGRTPSTEGER